MITSKQINDKINNCTKNNVSMHIGKKDVVAEEDKLGLDKYYNGLAKYIKTCDTPMTISIQGAWGIGKTTSLKQIENRLSQSADTDTKIKTLWFNTWQYSCMNSNEKLHLSLIQYLLSVVKKENSPLKADVDNTFNAIKAIVKQGVYVTANKYMGEGTSSQIERYIDEKNNIINEISELREKLERVISKYVGEKGRLVIFVDDLDRLQPCVAVELLEGIKNFLDCEKCVFLIAVDFDVIKQGVESKYGNNVNEDRAKMFFDKIIQVSFELPVRKYNVTSYIESLFINDIENIKDDIKWYVEISKIYLKGNPRTIKRVYDLLVLHDNIEHFSNSDYQFHLYAVLSLQVGDEDLYNELSNILNEFSEEKITNEGLLNRFSVFHKLIAQDYNDTEFMNVYKYLDDVKEIIGLIDAQKYEDSKELVVDDNMSSKEKKCVYDEVVNVCKELQKETYQSIIKFKKGDKTILRINGDKNKFNLTIYNDFVEPDQDFGLCDLAVENAENKSKLGYHKSNGYFTIVNINDEFFNNTTEEKMDDSKLKKFKAYIKSYIQKEIEDDNKNEK